MGGAFRFATDFNMRPSEFLLCRVQTSSNDSGLLDLSFTGVERGRRMRSKLRFPDSVLKGPELELEV